MSFAVLKELLLKYSNGLSIEGINSPCPVKCKT